jgi:hypothetical protein
MNLKILSKMSPKQLRLAEEFALSVLLVGCQKFLNIKIARETHAEENEWF